MLGWYREAALEVCTNQYSLIEHLVIGNDLYVDQFLSLLSYVPQLRRLSINSLTESWSEQDKVSANLLNCLTHFSLKMCHMTFDSLIQLMRELFRNVQVLHLTTENSSTSPTYIDTNKWQQLITDHLPYLRVFDIHIKRFINNADDQLRIEAAVNQFTSRFWIEKQWFFAHQLYLNRYGDYLLFYSINPYRYRQTSYLIHPNMY